MKKPFLTFDSSMASLALVASLIMTMASCKKAEEVTPNTNKPSVTVTFDANYYGIQKDFSVSADVSTTGDSAFITISTNGTQATGAIYMMYQKDNNISGKFTKHPNGTSIPAAGYKGSKFDGTGVTAFNFSDIGDYTFNIPNSVNTAWKITVPILLRSDANSVSDVFTIWVTQNGKSGRFDNPAKNLAYGIATVKLNYTNETLINYYETTLGNSKDTLGSFFATNYGTNYTRSYANTTTGIGATIDFMYNTVTTATGAGTIYYFGSPNTSTNELDSDIITGFNSSGFGAITNFTQVKSTNTNFDNISGDNSLSTAVDAVISSSESSNKVAYTSDPANSVFAFVTHSGKKGLVKIISAAGDGSTSGEAKLQVKVQR